MVSVIQFEKIRQQAHESGYIKIATYLRDLALNRNQFIEERIIETNQNVKKVLEVLHGRRK